MNNYRLTDTELSALKAIAANIAQTLKERPHLWRRGPEGLLGGGPCCLVHHLIRRGLNELGNYQALYRAFCEAAPIPWGGVSTWNDAPERTVDDVIAACERVASC